MSDNDSASVLNPPFSLTPATAVGGIIDYSTSAGCKLYSAVTAKVEEDLFDCTANDLYGFLRAVKDKAREFGWDHAGLGILSIPDDARIKQMAINLDLQDLNTAGGYNFPASHLCITNRSRDTTIDFCLCTRGILESIKYTTMTPYDLYTLLHWRKQMSRW